MTKLIRYLQTYKLGLVRIGKGSKSKNVALKAKDDEEEELSKDENSQFKAYITRQFKKFIKNANFKMNDKDCKKFGFPPKKSQDRLKMDNKEGGQGNNIPSGPKCFGCQGYGHMKQ